MSELRVKIIIFSDMPEQAVKKEDDLRAILFSGLYQ